MCEVMQGQNQSIKKTTVLQVFALNSGASKYTEQKWTEKIQNPD